jgi:hypothetical protein
MAKIFKSVFFYSLLFLTFNFVLDLLYFKRYLHLFENNLPVLETLLEWEKDSLVKEGYSLKSFLKDLPIILLGLAATFLWIEGAYGDLVISNNWIPDLKLLDEIFNKYIIDKAAIDQWKHIYKTVITLIKKF